MKHMIWSNCYDEIEAIAKDIRAGNPDLTEEESLDEARELNDGYLEDERDNLNVSVGGEIIVLGSLGLWNGRRQAYRVLKGPDVKIRDCLNITCGDYIEWYVDERGDMMIRDYHHDGQNLYTFRAWKPGITETQKENFLAKAYEGNATRRDVTRYTRRLGDYAARVYGWKLPGRSAAAKRGDAQ